MNFRFTKNLIQNPLKGGLSQLLLGLFVLCLSACSMINEDLPECAPPPKSYTQVNFVYDYNMLDKDLFYDHAGSVHLYIFDENGIYIDDEEKHKEFMSPKEDFTMFFPDTRLIPGNIYNFVAVAQGNTIGYDGSDEYNWFKLVNPMIKGVSRIEDYILRLDRDSNNDGFAEVGIINYKDQYGQTQQMIDTLWTTKPDEVQQVKIAQVNYKPSAIQLPDTITEVTIPMMRITNSIKVNVIGGRFNADTNPDDYHVVIHFPKGNGTVDFCGDLSQATQELYYQSLIKGMAPYTPKRYVSSSSSYSSYGYQPSTRDEEQTYALRSLFGVSRLMVNDESSLQLRDATKEGYPIIYEIPNFSATLAALLNESEYGNQEFLDREYDFEVEIGLDESGQVNYYAVSIGVVDWQVRVNLIGF
ncbi:MAG: FimB/Mfa2 family fimbrial subunit [Muribaculaceae bacterium]|nr:FimB/Mfa2 family fimbrial subunit [Muribaculaceae bacterium]